MNWLTILKAVLSIASSIAEYMKNKQLMDAGAAQSVLEGIRNADDAIKLANAARANANSVPVDTDPDNRD